MDRITALQLIDKAKRTREEALELQRLLTARTRAKKLTTAQFDKVVEIGQACNSVEEFHEVNRRNADPEQLQNWLTLQERVEDQLFWMRTWRDQDPSNPDYVSLEEGRADLEIFIETIGFIKDAANYSSTVLREFTPQWAIWADKSFHDLIWGPITPYFKDSQRLAALCSENEPTKVKALYGLRVGIPEYHYRVWCQSVAAQRELAPGVTA